MPENIKILYRDSAPSNVWINPNWKTGNLIYLDTDADFNISMSKEIQKLTDINQITAETALDTSIPATQKNLALLGISMDVEVIDNDYPDHAIDIELGSNNLIENKLSVIEYDKQAERIEIQLINSDDHWLYKIKDIYLDQLDFGEFEYTEANIETNWTDNALYNDGDPGYYMGHCYYGRYVNTVDGKVVLGMADFRPLIHAIKTMQLAFCKAGWKFSCPILETSTGRRLVTYSLKKELFSSEDDLKRIKFKAATEGTVRVQNKALGIDYFATKLVPSGGDWTKIKFNIEIEDPGGNYDPATGVFSRPGIFDFQADLTVDYFISKAGAFGAGSNIGFRLVHEYSNGYKQILDSFETGFTKSKTEQRGMVLNFRIDNLLLKPGESVYVEYTNVGPNVNVLRITNGSVFLNTPRKRIVNDGDTVDIGENLRHDSALDYVKGLCHLFQLMIYTDWSANTVYFLTPYDLDFFGDSITGYFNSSLNDIKAKQLTNSEKYTQLEKLAKNRIYSFKKSTDAKIKSYKWDEYEPYSRFIDNGFDNKIKENNEVFENPYFEASFSADTGAETDGGIIEAPWLVDNLNNELSFDIEPRILIAGGYENLFFFKPTPTGQTIDISEVYLWQWGSKTNIFPHVYQKCNMGTAIAGVYPDFTLTIPDIKIAYGYFENDLYELIHKKYDLFIRDNPEIKVKCQWNEEDYFSEHFRERALINSPNIHDGDLMGRIIKVNSWDAKSEIAEITFIADKQALDECIGFEVPLSCENYPYITYTKIGLVYTFSYDGNIASPIDTVTWRYKYEGVNFWTNGNVVSVPVKNTDVQMIMTFTNGCPPITLNHKIIVQLKPTVTTTKVGNLVEAQENGTHELTVSDTKIYYSEDGTNWKLYEIGIDINRLVATVSTLYFFAEVTYTTGDKRQSDISAISTQPAEGECPDPDQFVYPPTVVITKTPQSYFFYRSGEFNGKAVYDMIQYREKGKNQEWSEYNNEIISLMKCWEVRRSIVWCDEGCPPYCSPVVESDCGSCVNTLTPAITPVSVVCTHEQKWENPDIPASATWKVTPINDSIDHIPAIRTWIEQNDGAPIEIQEKTVIWHRWNFRTEYVYTWNIGETIDTLEVSEAIGLVIGSQHTLTLNIEYQSGDSNEGLRATIEGKIRSELGLLGFVDLEHYKLYVSVTGTTTKTLNIGFVAKHNPTLTWIGANLGTDELVTSTGNISSTGKEFQLETTTAPILENFTPYGTSFKVRFRVSTVDYFLDDASSNFNEMVANASSPILTDTLSAAITDTGTKYSLTGSMAGCAGTTTWLWLYGGVKKGESGKVISRVSTADVFIQANTEIILIAKCSTTGYCSYEKRSMLTV